MLYFERIYACYYFFFIKLRKTINRRYNEDISAVILMTISQNFLFLAFVVLFEKMGVIHKINISPLLALVIIWSPFFLWYKYFLSNRSRRNRIIDAYRHLPERNKLFWQIISFLNLIIPFIVFIVTLNGHW